MIEKSTWTTGAAAAILASTISACQPTPAMYDQATAKTAEEVGNVYVSAYPPVPWAAISDKLAPKHNLTTEQARTMAVQTTQAEVSQFLSMFGAGLGLGLPLRAEALTTTIGADGTQQTTGTRTRNYGSVPTSSGAGSTTIGETTLAPDLSKAPAALGVDGSTLLTAGTALYQQAQILDNQIDKQFLPEGYQAQLITFQVNLQPKRRDFPYDSYTDITFLPANWADLSDPKLQEVNKPGEVASDDGMPPVIVYPMVISDAMESTNIGRSIEIMRQAALSLSGMIGPVGVNASANGASDALNSILGQDRNSLVTLGRVSDHVLRLRLGAPNSGSSKWAMQPRTYNVSVFVLTREKTSTNRVRNLTAIAHTEFLDARDGKIVPDVRRRRELARHIAEIVFNYGFNSIDESPSCSGTQSTSTKPPQRSVLIKDDQKPELNSAAVDAHLNFLRAVDRGDFATIRLCLGLGDGLGKDKARLDRLLSSISEIQTDSRYATLLVALPSWAEQQLPPTGQFALFSDDTKSRASVALRGAKRLDAARLHSALVVTKTSGTASREERKPSVVLASAISLSSDGTEVDITFSSIAKLGLTPSAGSPLQLAIGDAADAITCNPPKCQRFAIIEAKLENDPVKNPIKASQTVLVPDTSGSAKVTLLVGKIDAKVKSPVRLTVEGGDLREVNGGVPSGKGIMASAESVITLLLGNLTPTRTVTVKALDGDSKPIGDPIIFTVDRSAGGK